MNVPLTKSKLDELPQGEGEGLTTFLKGDIHRRSPTDQVRASVVSCQPPVGASSLWHQTTAIHFLTDTEEAAKTAHSALVCAYRNTAQGKYGHSYHCCQDVRKPSRITTIHPMEAREEFNLPSSFLMK